MVASQPREPAPPKRGRKISLSTVIILVLAGLAGVTYYFGTPALQPSLTPGPGSCAGAVQIVVNNTAGNSSARYQPPPLTLVLGVNSTVAWVDKDQGFELHVISVAVPPTASQWDLNLTQGQTQCVPLTAVGSYTYEIFVPYTVAGTITVEGASQSST